MDYESLGLRIRRFRNSRKKTQEDMANALGIARSFYAEIETGRKTPSLENLIAIANLLNVSTDQLLVDNLTNTGAVADSELEYVLLDCNEKEISLITQNAIALRKILRAFEIK